MARQGFTTSFTKLLVLLLLSTAILGAVIASAAPAPAPQSTDAGEGEDVSASDIDAWGTGSTHTSEKHKRCRGKILKRKAWHTFSPREKKSYIDAELCLMWQKPSKSKYIFPAAVSRFDDLQAVHQILSDYVHFTGWFLPFHRMFVWAHEKLLREECGYKGAQPFWDESRDAGQFVSSDIFNPTSGFGGSGDHPTKSVGFSAPPFLFNYSAKCITTGPFANYTLHLGPGILNTDHCLSRKIDDTVSRNTSQIEVDHCLKQDTLETFWPCIEWSPHNGGHGGIGGEMLNPISSPADPLFYLHHAWLDKIWYNWQGKDVANRKKAVTGHITKLPPTDGSEWIKATLEDMLPMYGVAEDWKLGDVVDIERGMMECIEYVESSHPTAPASPRA